MVRQRPDRLRLGRRGRDPLVGEQPRQEVPEQGPAVGREPAQLRAAALVPHACLMASAEAVVTGGSSSSSSAPAGVNRSKWSRRSFEAWTNAWSGRDAAVRRDLDHELLVVRDVAEPGHLDLVVHARGSARRPRPAPPRPAGIARRVPLRRDVAAPGPDADLEREPAPGGHGREVQVGAHHLDARPREVGPGGRLRAPHLEPGGPRLGAAGQPHHQLLQIEEEVREVLLDAGHALGVRRSPRRPWPTRRPCPGWPRAAPGGASCRP